MVGARQRHLCPREYNQNTKPPNLPEKSPYSRANSVIATAPRDSNQRISTKSPEIIIDGVNTLSLQVQQRSFKLSENNSSDECLRPDLVRKKTRKNSCWYTHGVDHRKEVLSEIGRHALEKGVLLDVEVRYE